VARHKNLQHQRSAMTKFKFYIGGYFGTSFLVKLVKDELHFYISDYPVDFSSEKPRHIIPTKDNLDWQKLVKFLNLLDWKRHYKNDDILDGTQWEISFVGEKSKLTSYGSNEYPIEFNKLIRLLRTITRKHFIPFDLY
jgi:hypothetical protein